MPVLLKQAYFTYHRVLNATHGTESPLFKAESHPPMLFTEVSFSTATGWKKSKCPLADERLKIAHSVYIGLLFPLSL